MEDQTITVKQAIHPDLMNTYLYWEDRAKTLDNIEAIEKVWAIQFRFKYDALRLAGFGRVASFLMMLKAVK